MSPNPSQGEVPEEVTLVAGRTVEECDGALGQEPARSITAEYDPSCKLVQFVQYGEEVFGTLEPVEPGEWAEIAKRLTGPAIRSQIDQEWEERLKEKDREYDGATQELATELIDARKEADKAEAALSQRDQQVRRQAAAALGLLPCYISSFIPDLEQQLEGEANRVAANWKRRAESADRRSLTQPEADPEVGR